MKITKGGTITVSENGDVRIDGFRLDAEGQTISTAHEFMLAFADCIHAALVHAAMTQPVTFKRECDGFTSDPKSPPR